ncbi:protein FAM13A isoform X2 [Drosophila rhopaloa]|nr:protein FAM13A isoform X2 [Drosophila rhopaloa]
MRHPTTGLNEDDLSRLTGSSSSTASCGSAASSSSSSSSSSSNPAARHEVVRSPEKPTPAGADKSHLNSGFHSTYLPEIIHPALEWQKSSRKRKERLDSSSAFGQDRKLQRSNSEELLTEPAALVSPTTQAAANLLEAQCEVIRRVSSEDFKRTASYANYRQEFEREQEESSELGENNASLANLPAGEAAKERPRLETSPARQPPKEASDDSECEHERRRSSERFCKSRQPPVRKSGVAKKGGGGSGSKYLPSRRDEQSAYKYDLSALKYERRGFISSRKQQQSQQQSVQSASDHNDNNLIDFHQQQKELQTKRSASISPTPTTSSSAGSDDSTPTSNAPAPVKAKPQRQQQSLDLTSAQESLPWERGDEPAPILSRRYAHSRPHVGGNLDAAAQLAKVMPYPQQLPKQAATVQLHSDISDMDCCLEPMDAVRAFSSLENMRTRDVMQQVLPAMMVAFQSPEERLKAINRRVTVLKKKLVQLEESLEQRLGYRPSQAERLNDKYMKNALAELSKLRKERHELKTDPIAALGLKVGSGGGGGGVIGGQEVAKKLERMKATLAEIELNLNEKRVNGHRSEQLEDLSADQLVQEKSAVQHGLLYFESLYGHPITKEERDAARPLYDRYRQLKRLVSRTVMFGAGTGVPELPTILEHEAMVFEATSTPLQYSSNNSTETTNSPSDSNAPNTLTQNASSDESTTTTTLTGPAAGAVASGQENQAASENISALSLDQLWEQLDRARDEKSLLKATIREYESLFEEQNGRKMLKQDRRSLETETYAQYKEKKAKVRLLQALIKKHIGQ